jgi:hypothetical protein
MFVRQRNNINTFYYDSCFDPTGSASRVTFNTLSIIIIIIITIIIIIIQNTQWNATKKNKNLN